MYSLLFYAVGLQRFVLVEYQTKILWFSFMEINHFNFGFSVNYCVYLYFNVFWKSHYPFNGTTDFIFMCKIYNNMVMAWYFDILTKFKCDTRLQIWKSTRSNYCRPIFIGLFYWTWGMMCHCFYNVDCEELENMWLCLALVTDES